MKPGIIIAAILAAGAIGGGIAGVMTGGLPWWLTPGPSEAEQVETCRTLVRARVGDYTLSNSPTADRRDWPHKVLMTGMPFGMALCRFASDGSITAEIAGDFLAAGEVSRILGR